MATTDIVSKCNLKLIEPPGHNSNNYSQYLVKFSQITHDHIFVTNLSPVTSTVDVTEPRFVLVITESHIVLCETKRKETFGCFHFSTLLHLPGYVN